MTTLEQTLGPVDITTKELSRRLIYTGCTKKIDCKNFWDSHGTKIPYAPTQYKFDCEKNFEVWEVVTETHYPGINFTQTSVDWLLLVEGEKLDSNLGWIERFTHLKTKLKLECCIGCG